MAKKKKIGRYPNMMIITSLTAALFLIGLCGMLVIQSKKLVSIIRENIEVRVFLDKSVSQSAKDSVLTAIKKQPFVLGSSADAEAAPVIFVSKEEAAKDFIEGTKENFTTLLEDNPMRDSYRVRVREEYFEEAKLKQIKEELEKINHVYEVAYQENLADDINRNVTKIYIILSSFALILLIIIVLLVNNTIKLAIYSQRFLIRSMQLVGATNGFIQRPFIVRGAFQGLVAGIVACILLALLQQGAVKNIEGLAHLQEYNKLIFLGLAVIALGIIVGIISTFQSLYRYLRITADELY
jgi:cell division transport system permease protein